MYRDNRYRRIHIFNLIASDQIKNMMRLTSFPLDQPENSSYVFKPSVHFLGRSQAVKAPEFDSGIRWFKSSRPSQCDYTLLSTIAYFKDTYSNFI